MLAGKALQRTAAVLVTMLASANGLLFLVADMLPATVPLGVAAAVMIALEWRRSRARLPARKRYGVRLFTPELAQPGTA
jgi:hypothetical protein